LSNTLTTLEKWQNFQDKYFPERQVFLRSKGRVRFLTISTNMQLAMSSAASVFLVWGLVTSYAFLTHDLLLEEKNSTISNISADYRNLSDDFSSLELEVERRAKQLEERQAFLEEIVGDKQAKAIPVDATTQLDGVAQQDAPSALISDASAAKVKASSPRKLSIFEGLMGSQEPEILLTAGDRRDLLLTRLQNAESRQSAMASKLLADIRTQLAQIDKSLKPTSLTNIDLVRQWQSDAAAMGGPYRPEAGFQPVFNANDHLNYSNLLEDWQRLEIATKALDSVPIGKPAEKFYVSSRFGRRRDPLKKNWARHPGLDLAGWPGTAIYATAPGKVSHAGWFGPYGRMVEVEHSNGFKTRYGHMRKVRVKKGELVNVGTRVGDMGKTGRTTGTHLHYEIWFEGKVRDPAPFLKAANDVLKIQERYEKTSK